MRRALVKSNEWKERNVFESRAEAMGSGGKIFQARWVQGEVKVRGQGLREHAGPNGVRCSQ